MKNIIRKILREEIDLSWVDEYYSEYKDPLEPIKEFIFNEMKDCELIPSEKKPGYTKYVKQNGNVIFYDTIDLGKPVLYTRSYIWYICYDMGCSIGEFQEICKEMLYRVHGREVNTVKHNLLPGPFPLSL